MAVAKSYKSYTICGEPYEKNGKMYIVIAHPNTGNRREARWYTDAEYNKLYPEDKIKIVPGAGTFCGGKKIRSLKDTLGFEKGYITIFKGDTYSLLEWFQEEPKCRYHCSFGWYIVSTDELPQLPAGIEPIQLQWKDVAFEDEDQLRPESQIKEHIDSLMYNPSPSKWQGKIGDRLEKVLTVTKAISIEGYYGNSTMHIFSDLEENIYVWTTAAKTLEVGKTYVIRGTVREHKTFKNVPQTILTRCAICQDKTV